MEPRYDEPPLNGWVVWPEREPAYAVFCRTRWSRWWAMFGPLAIKASLSGKRMRSAWPVDHRQPPIAVARRCERLVR